MHKGFAVGYCGSLNPPQPKAVVMVIRLAAKNEVFKRVIAGFPPLNEPAAKRVEQGRTIRIAAAPPVRWWYEKDDAVFSFAPPEGVDPVIDVLHGKTPTRLEESGTHRPGEGGAWTGADRPALRRSHSATAPARRRTRSSDSTVSNVSMPVGG